MKKGIFIFFVLMIFFSLIVIAVDYDAIVSVDDIIDSNDKKLDYVPGEIIVKYKEPVKIRSFLSTTDKIQQKKPEFEKITFDQDTDIEEVIEEYKQRDDVEYAEPNYIYETFAEPSDTYFSSQWAAGIISLNKTWNMTQGSENIIIAVIDTGVDWDHPDLSVNIWNNTDEIADNSIDDDSNGYTDDIRGYDFVDSASSCDSGDDCDTEDNNPMDYQGHGTHCSGIAAAVGNNSIGVAGACWNCKIMPVRAGYKNTINGGGSLSSLDIAQALYYAADNNATIISMSFGSGSDSTPIRNGINYAYERGVILVAAAGNNNNQTLQYPAAYPNVISIAATDFDDSSASYSSYGNWVDLAAPGGDTPLLGEGIYSTIYDDTYTWVAGTSMACPMVAGSIGLMLSVLKTRNQTLINNTLAATGTDVTFNNTDIKRINVYSALLSLDDTGPDVSIIHPDNNSRSLNSSILINVSVTDIINNVSTCLLEWNYTINYTMNISANASSVFCSYNKSINTTGNYFFRIFANDTNNNLNSSEVYIYKKNAFPVMTVSINSSDNNNLTNGTITGFFTYSDENDDTLLFNETRWYNNTVEIVSYRNITNVSNVNISKLQNWTYSVRGFDGYNWSGWYNATITINNHVPYMESIADITTNETSPVNISVNATDIDLDPLNYSINDSRFSQNENKFSWLTNLSDSGTYNLRINVTDGLGYSEKNFTVNIIDEADFDNDNNPDYNDTDDDNDGIEDSEDFLTGNSSNINSTINITFFINDSINTSRILNGSLLINITDQYNDTLIEFDWNFTNNTLRVNWTIDYNSSTGTLMVNNLAVSKTVTINKSSSSNNYVCIYNGTITNISLMSSSCTAANETKVACTGSNKGYTCTTIGNKFKVQGVTHSAIMPIYVAPVTIDPGSSTSSGGGGGGGGNIDTSLYDNLESFFATRVEKGEKVDIEIDKPRLAFTNVAFDALDLLVKITIRMESINESKITDKLDNAYEYIEVTTIKLDEEDISDPEIRFRVDNDWLKSHDALSVMLNRLVNGSWTALDTNLFKTDDDYHYYRSRTPGFSFFAIDADVNNVISDGSDDSQDIEIAGNDSVIGTLAETDKDKEKITYTDRTYYIITAIVVFILTFVILFYIIVRKGNNKKK